MISIITATFNSEKTINQTLNSLLRQTFSDWELLICDGGSNDNTLNIISGYNDHRIKVVSSRDTGIFDAYNKGLEHITGDIFGTLNSDDHLFDETILEFIDDQFKQDSRCDLIYGNVKYLKRNNVEKISRQWKNNFYSVQDFRLGFMPAHPTVYMRYNSKFSAIRYDASYRYAGDFEYLIRICKAENVLMKYCDKTFVNMLDGGTADGNLITKMKHWKELNSILKKHFNEGIGIKFLVSKIMNRLKEHKF